MGWIEWFVVKNSDTTSWHELLHQFGLLCTKFCKATKRFQIHPNSTKYTKTCVQSAMGVDQVHSLRKIPKRLRGTDFCTSSVNFAQSVVTQPNGPKCSQIVQNASKHQFRVQWGGSGAFITKNSDATSLHQFGPFCIDFRKAKQSVPKALKQYEMRKNISLGSNGVDRVRSL